MTAPPQVLADTLADRYTIGDELGQGGMATVYLAQDLKHDRKVALKVLRPELAAVIGAERFLNEIKVTANLQHPHILALYDSGEAEQFLYYVMPYVQGESLDDKLKREKQIGVEEAVRIASEVASALDYAHRQGVVHRDIKPANIMLQEGQALVADFGIALALTHAGGTRITETGLSLGTPHYMSPEQATGDRDIDARSDIYSLGAVLYESLAGEPPHTGGTIQAVISKVVTEIPKPLGELRQSVPVHVGMAVEKALAKIPADRFGTAADFATALKDPKFTLSYSATATAVPSARSTGRARGWLPYAIAAVAVVVGVMAGRATKRGERDVPQVARFVIDTDSTHRLVGAPSGTVALSPDGATLVYAGFGRAGLQLYVRPLDDLGASPIPGTEGALSPFFSPDGRWIGFYAGTVLKKVALSGGAPVSIPNAPPFLYQSAAWLDQETLLLTTSVGAIQRLDGDGSLTTMATADTANEETGLIVSGVIRDRRILLGIASTQGGVSGRGIAINVDTGERTTLMETLVNGLAYYDGYLVWAQPDGALLAAPFDARSLRLTGSPVTLGQGVRVSVGGPAQFYVSENGSLVYVPEFPYDLVLVDRSGRSEVVTDIQRRFHSPRFSPDAMRIAVDFTQQGSRDVWLLNLGQRTLSRLTFDNDGHDPVWTPDGRKVAYATSRNGIVGIFQQNADGSGVAESVYVGATLSTAGIFTPDGGQVITLPIGASGSADFGILPLTGDRIEEPLLATGFNEESPALSPAGRWLAYSSDESGKPEVYVRPFPGPGAKVLVSQNGGGEPVWSHDGTELFYRGFGDQGPMLVSAVVETTPEFRVLSRTMLFDVTEYEPASPHANYDVSPDGQRFVMVHQGRLSEIVLIQNWPEEVRRRSAGEER